MRSSPLISTRRQFCAALGGTAAGYAQERRRPNIVVILADDLGWGDLRQYNRDSKIPTPNIDRVAAEGTRFTDVHSPSAVCTPTRYALMTGRYCWRSSLKKGVLNGYSPNLIEPGRLTIPGFLKREGYYTAGVGKWHLGLGDQGTTNFDAPLRPGPPQHGFDSFFGIPASLDMPPYLYFENDRVVERATDSTPGRGGDNPRGAFWRAGAIAPSFDIEGVMATLTGKTVGLIRDRAKSKDVPFFLYFAMTGPHTPWMPTRAFQNKSGAGEYGDFVAQMDHSVGEIMKALEATGAARDTLLIFTSDNGAYWPPDQIERYGHRSNDGWRGMKADIFEGGHRVPFMARWPGVVKSQAIRNDLGCLTDLFATVADAARAPRPKAAAEDSFSLFPAMTGSGNSPARASVVHHSADGMFAIREGEWKLIEGHGSGGFTKPVRIEAKTGEAAGQLYNIAEDPAETRDLWTSRPAVVERLRKKLDLIRQQGHSRL